MKTQSVELAEKVQEPSIPAPINAVAIVSAERERNNSLIAMGAKDSSIDAHKLEVLMKVNQELLKTQAKIDFDAAMNRLQPLLPIIEKMDKADKHNYAKHENIEKQIRDLYLAEGFKPRYSSRANPDGTTTYYGILTHVGGHSEQAEITLPMDDTNKAKNKLQAAVGTFTYARRVLLAMMFNIVLKDVDVDGSLHLLDPIDEVQLQEIQRLIEESGTNPKFFCESHLQIKSLKEMPGRLYPKAVADLKKKIELKKAKAV